MTWEMPSGFSFLVKNLKNKYTESEKISPTKMKIILIPYKRGMVQQKGTKTKKDKYEDFKIRNKKILC